MVRILHVIGEMNCGGAETMIMNIYRNIDRTKVQFDFVVHSSQKAFYDNEITKLGGIIYRTNKYCVKNIVSYTKFWCNFFKQHPEYTIVHGHIGSSAAIYLACARKYGRHTIAHSHATKDKSKDLRAIVFNIMSFPVRNIAEYFFACSYQAGVERYGIKVVGSKKFRVINNGIDSEKYKYSEITRKKIRDRYQVKDSTLVVGHVGRFSGEKNHIFLIEVFARLQEKCQDSELWLFGMGALENAIRKKVEEKGLSDSVKFMGVCDSINEFLQAFDLFLFPSVFEGLGIALVEAQAAGVPCIVSENIQDEADIGANLVTKLGLEISINSWSEIALQKRNIKRVDTSMWVVKSGFDIKEVTQQISEFYLGLL